MVKIMLIRHGETAWNNVRKIQGHSNVELAPEGIHQAHLLAAHCPFDRVDSIYSSDLLRAKVTAEILAEKFNVDVQEMPELRETNFGDWEGKRLAELEKDEPENLETFFRRPDELKISHAETFFEVQMRAMLAIEKIIAEHKFYENPQIIVAAHGAINRVILCSILDIPLKRMWSLSQFNTCVNIFREEDGFYTVDLINSTAHLVED